MSASDVVRVNRRHCGYCQQVTYEDVVRVEVKSGEEHVQGVEV